MRTLITGSSGFIGSQLIPFLENRGNEIFRLVRNHNIVSETNIFWNPDKGELDKKLIENFQVIVHLAGENISSRRWSKKQKEKIYGSRINSTRFLVEILKKIKSPPHSLICASAVGIYGNRGSETLTEASPKGNGFLPDLVWEWEKIASSAEGFGIRVVSLRTGVVLSKRGGALAKLLLPFKIGLGSIVGSGNQYFPWITLNDVNEVISFIMENRAISGAVNVVAPETNTNYEFSKALGKVLRRPVIFKVPEAILKLILGEMADQLLLSSTKVVPEVLTKQGYNFLHKNIDEALAAVLEDK
jgi:uncharacterized protein (TIGR01777 family)